MLDIRTLDIPGYERVVIGRDASAGLHAVIAVHSTRRGPALGGIRMHPYPSQDAALADALRLSHAMSLKAASSDLALGGGKAVVVGDPHAPKSHNMLLTLGDLIESLDGAYLAAEDAGFFDHDIDIVAQRTRHVTGAGPHLGGSGDCSAATALGVVLGIQAAARHRLGDGDLSGLHVAIQGLGKVGLTVAQLLHERGVTLTVADVVEDRARLAADRFHAAVVPPDRIHAVRADLFCPCALGGVLSDRTLPELTTPIVAGGANNQFADESTGPADLHQRNILHAPDFIINAGGLIRLYALEVAREPSADSRMSRIPQRLAALFDESHATDTPPLAIARRIAENKLVDTPTPAPQ